MSVLPLRICVLLVIAVGCGRTAAPQRESSEPAAPVALDLLPGLLSQTGLFENVASLKPSPSLVAYDVNVPFWSDGAQKRRWIGLPPGERIAFSAEGDWKFPTGTVLVKHFELPGKDSGQASTPIETRVLICESDGAIRGATYRWRDDRSDAEIVAQPTTRALPDGRRWYLPGPEDCKTCHIPATGGVLGVKTRQLNRALDSGGTNQLVLWQRAGMFEPSLAELHPDELPRLPRLDDPSENLTARARSYLDANCSNCHRPAGVAGQFDARYDVPLERQNIVNGPVLIDLGLDHAKLIAPNDPWRSLMLVRLETSDQTRMPPIGHETVDRDGARLLRGWIASMPARPVLAPPRIEPAGGEFKTLPLVVLRHADTGATIRYTLDGSRPTASSPEYREPIHLLEPTTLRARAYKDGSTSSIIVQETFVTASN